MDDLITVINKIQDVFTRVGNSGDTIKLPQIVVVGAQSAGKSSVLENVVGRDFLPRGSGIVTRRPLILQLYNVPQENIKARTMADGAVMEGEWAQFDHCHERIFTNFNHVRQEIEAETDRVTGKNKGISPRPISLKIFSHKVVNLTLIDLPGITKVPVGDQPKDIERQIRDMIETFISNPSSIILAVTPANQDLATSEPLKIASEYDPEGKRTIAVLTKLDLMDRGTDANDILTGKVIHVKLGIIGVINRSQEAINKSQAIEEAVRYEREYLNKHYPRLASVNGTPYLAKRLNKLLLHHIKATIPALKNQVSGMISEYQMLLAQTCPVDDKAGSVARILADFEKAFNAEIVGSAQTLNTSILCTGAHIRHLFSSQFEHELSMLTTDNMPIKEILIAVRNSSGAREAIFIPEQALEYLAYQQIKRLQQPCQETATKVFEEMKKIINRLGPNMQTTLKRFPNLALNLVGVISELLNRQLQALSDFITVLITNETCYINVRHPEFLAAQPDLNKDELSALERTIYVGLAANPSMAMISTHHNVGGGSQQPGQQQQNGQQQQQLQYQQQNGAPPVPNRNAPQPPASQPQMNGHLPPIPPNPQQQQSVTSRFMPAFLRGNQERAARRTRRVSRRLSDLQQPHLYPQLQQHLVESISDDESDWQLVHCLDGPSPTGSTQQTMATVSQAVATGPRAAPSDDDLLWKPNLKEERDCLITHRYVRCYFDIVKRSIVDKIPKAIMNLLVNGVTTNLGPELYKRLYKGDMFDSLLEEDPASSERRRELQNTLRVLCEANAILNEVNDAGMMTY